MLASIGSRCYHGITVSGGDSEMYEPVLIQECDRTSSVPMDMEGDRLPRHVFIELQNAHMVNNVDPDDEGDAWFDSDELPDHMRVLEDAEFFNTYCD